MLYYTILKSNIFTLPTAYNAYLDFFLAFLVLIYTFYFTIFSLIFLIKSILIYKIQFTVWPGPPNRFTQTNSYRETSLFKKTPIF